MNKILRRVLLGVGAVLLVLVLLGAGVVLARDRIAKALITQAVARTGFGLELKNLHIALAPPGVEVEGLKLTNPPDFPEAGALEIGRLKLSYDYAASTHREARLPEVTFELAQLVVVRKADGEVNFQRFAQAAKGQPPAGREEPAPTPPAPPPPPSEPRPDRKVRIDRLNIRLGTVLVRTYRSGAPAPSERRFTLNVDKQYTNVTNDDFKKIVTALTLEILFNSPDALANLGDGLLNAGGQGAQAAKQAGQQLQQQFKGLFNNLKKQIQ